MRSSRRYYLLLILFSLTLFALIYYIFLYFQRNRQIDDLNSLYTRCKSTPIIIPCSELDTERVVFNVPALGRFCLEKDGEDVIKSVLRLGIPWEPELNPYFEKYVKRGSIAIDVGAHIGTHTLTMARLTGAEGLVHAFEPQVKIYQELLVNLDLNNITNVYAHFVALGDRHMRVSMDPPLENNEGGTSLGQGGNRVELRRLDLYRFDNVSFIKIDAEGASYSILKGSEETIRNNKPAILVEVYWAGSEKQNEEATQIIELIYSYGYKTERRIGDDVVFVPEI
jgi:FkbM family methyltransferase